jgi:hypothetical protein
MEVPRVAGTPVPESNDEGSPATAEDQATGTPVVFVAETPVTSSHRAHATPELATAAAATVSATPVAVGDGIIADTTPTGATTASNAATGVGALQQSGNTAADSDTPSSSAAAPTPTSQPLYLASERVPTTTTANDHDAAAPLIDISPSPPIWVQGTDATTGYQYGARFRR